MAQNGITTTKVATAKRELEGMNRSLREWLKYRTLNDKVASGLAKGRIPPGIAKQVIARSRDMGVERELATRLHSLLSELGVQDLPNPDVSANPSAAVELANIALAGGKTAMGGIGAAPWLWPVLIVGGLLLAVTTAVKTAADVAKERERYACIQAGACTDYGFWLKAGGVAAVGYVAWKHGLGDFLRGLMKKGRS